jgi:MarR family transcriptional regulator, transcriptional regulator for hemolysin
MNKTDQYIERSFGFLIGDTSRLMRKRFDRQAKELGLTRAQWRVLAQLRRREGINQSALAEILEVSNITLARHIDRLEEKGWVERRADPDDRRKWRLFLKAEVQPIMDKMREISISIREEVMAGIPDHEREKLIDQLLVIKANLAEPRRE